MDNRRNIRIVSLSLLLFVVAIIFLLGWPPTSRADDYPRPPLDSRFEVKRLMGHSRTAYIPIIRSSPAQTQTLHLIYLQDYQHIAYRISRDNGATWQPSLDDMPAYIADEVRWGGAIGNLSATVDNKGTFTACWFQLYGFAYPGIRCRQRTPDTTNPDGSQQPGEWLPDSGVPGTNTPQEPMKVVQVTSDANADLHLLVGRGEKSLYYVATHDGTSWNPLTQMPTIPTSLPNPDFLPSSVIMNRGKGVELFVWGDARGIDGQGGDSWQLMTALARPTADGTSSWQTYYFTDTNTSGHYTNGAGQYTPQLAAVTPDRAGLVFTCRPDLEQPDADICYREWHADLAAKGLHMGWLTDTITIAATAPPDSRSPSIAVDPATNQIYVCWQDGWHNLQVTCSHSADGVHWHAPYLVDGGDYTREKMVSIAIAHDSGGGGWLNIVWADDTEHDLGIYYTRGPLPDLYPAPPPATPTAMPAP